MTDIKINSTHRYIKKLILETLEEFYTRCEEVEYPFAESSKEYHTESMAVRQLLKELKSEEELKE